MGSDGTALRFADRVAHANGTVIANVDGQFWHSQLTSTLQFFDHTVNFHAKVSRIFHREVSHF
jgi:hypothetical protein